MNIISDGRGGRSWKRLWRRRRPDPFQELLEKLQHAKALLSDQIPPSSSPSSPDASKTSVPGAGAEAASGTTSVSDAHSGLSQDVWGTDRPLQRLLIRAIPPNHMAEILKLWLGEDALCLWEAMGVEWMIDHWAATLAVRDESIVMHSLSQLTKHDYGVGLVVIYNDDYCKTWNDAEAWFLRALELTY